MPLDPSTKVARTEAGVAELSKPANGLSISQRKILTFLDTPKGFGPMVDTYQLDPQKFERDLSKLAELKLVNVPGLPPPPRPPLRPQGRATVSPAGPGPASISPVIGTPVVLGRPGTASPLRWIVPLALVVAGALGYVMLKAPSAPKPGAAAVASDTPRVQAPAAPTIVAATPSAISAPTDPVPPVAATMLEGANSKERKPDTRDVRNDPAPAAKIEAKADARGDTRADTRADARSDGKVDGKVDARGDARAAMPEVAGKSIPVAAPVFTSGAPALASTQVAAAPVRTATVVPTTMPTAVPAAAAAPMPAAPPPVQLAAAAPSAAEAHPPAATARPSLAALTPLSREQPAFPREAISAGISKGLVKAHVTVDASGKVISVSILESQPHRVFDRAVTNALQQWTFNAGAGTRSTDIDISFDRD